MAKEKVEVNDEVKSKEDEVETLDSSETKPVRKSL